jgi:anti-sigma regulatory factor (Ser/Thr protein kinase)
LAVLKSTLSGSLLQYESTAANDIPSRRGSMSSATEGYRGAVAAVEPMRIKLDNSDLAPRRARHALRSWLDDVDCEDPVPDDALIVVSELVTNVVMHTASDSVVIAAFDDNRLRIEVHDGDPHGLVAATGAAVRGFGLSILESLCDAWGWEPTDSGKRVWTETLC